MVTPIMKPKAAVLLACTLGLASCKDDPKATAVPAASGAPTSSAIPDDLVVNSFFGAKSGVALAVDGGAADFGGGAPDEGSDVKSKVLDPGGEPKAKLSYAHTLGKTQTIVATLADEVTGPDVPEGAGKQPTMKFTVAFTPKKKLDAQKTQIEMKTAKLELVGAPPELQGKIAAVASAVQKIGATFWVTPAGDTGDLEFSGTESLGRGGGEQLLGMLARVQSLAYVPVPSAAVGPGAKWKSSVAAGDGAFVDATYTLVGKSDAGWDLKVETSTRMVPKTVGDPRTGKKMTLEVKGGSAYQVTTLFDGPTFKASGESKNEVIASAGGEGKRTNVEKSTTTIERPAK